MNGTEGFVVIGQNQKGDIIYAELVESTKYIYISRDFSQRELVEILKRCSYLKEIQVSKSIYNILTKGHFELCRQQNVEIVQGYLRPELAERRKENDHPQSPLYVAAKEVLNNISSEQIDRLQELFEFEVIDVQMAVRYFCLQGEPRISLVKLAREFDLGEGYNPSSMMRERVYSVVKYLSPDFEVSKSILDRYGRLKRKVIRKKRKREELRKEALREEIEKEKRQAIVDFCAEIGIVKIPEGYPMTKSWLHVLRKVSIAIRDSDPNLAGYIERNPRNYQIISYRLGLDDYVFKNDKKVRREFKLSMHFSVSKIEQEFYKWMGIVTD